MSPAVENMSNSSALKIVNLPKLKDDGSNWITYKEWILNTLTHKGFRRHIAGTARKPAELEKKPDGLYLPGGKTALTDDEVEAHEKTVDEFAQKEASVQEVIYETISKSTFLQIKNEKLTSEVWTKLTSIFENKGDMVQMDMLTKLQNLSCAENGDVRKHISDMLELKEELAGMGTSLTDTQFSAIIRKSLPASY
jgi:hypothetical protein